jgi:hypothetical protein
VDETGLDAPVVGPQPEVDVRGGDEGVPADEEGDIAGLGGREDGFGLLLDAGAVSNLDVDAVKRLEVGDGGPGEPAGVQLGEDPVGDPDCVPALERDRALVVEAEADEGEHGTDTTTVA